jgi:hypothetical protein
LHAAETSWSEYGGGKTVSSSEARLENIAIESGAAKDSPSFPDYVSLVKEGRALLTALPAASADSSLPEMVTVDSAQPARTRDAGDNVSRERDLKAPDCVDELMKRLDISMDQTTDPDLMKDILHNDMKLDDCPAVVKLLGPLLSEKESMAPMLERIRESIITKQPELHEFIARALNENLIQAPDDAAKKMIVRSLNHTMLLDGITKGMADDYHVQEAVRDHLLNKRKEMGIHEGFVGSARDIYKAMGNDLFFAAKAKTMDNAFDKQLKFRKEGHIPSWDIHMRQASLELNLAEAILTDKAHGYSDNARAGLDLARHIFSRAEVKGDNRFIDYNLTQKWNSLYESWNLAFMTGNVTDPQILFPKLLIPQVIDAKPEEYLFNRSMALWMTINFDLFHKMDKKPEVVIPDHEQLARCWGEVNAKYGNTLGKNGASA